LSGSMTAVATLAVVCWSGIVAPAIYGKGLMTTAGGSAVAMLKGVLPAEERTVTDLASQVEEGQLDALVQVSEGSLPPVLLGRDPGFTVPLLPD